MNPVEGEEKEEAGEERGKRKHKKLQQEKERAERDDG